MDAKNFIRVYGFEKARGVVKDAPESATHYELTIDGDFYFKRNKFEWLCFSDDQLISTYFDDHELCRLIALDDLKNFVDSMDLILKHGGIENLKFNILLLKNGLPERLKRAIADYEYIYAQPKPQFAYTVLTGAQVGSVLQLTPQIDDMGDDSNLDHHLSPFCEVRDV
ncbi:hypothetical protein A0118_RS02555 [Acinetobacter baumannii]|uniref:hypothetical protein n=1 Tax=Acinetobacter baumannii TaxID=470 RepID=UPI000D64ECFF|nr:hypothetical protein [Acinetobacter baumannii]EHU1613550.1 hypothetical protein [Acinetobacter baumannii]EHU2312233.1 hypothetical protein [Acinetobacter baumannii]EHU2314559.1 hypothetical protein [Acinetobacter baumannii]EHU2482996.1 hypothetical protein [Acinetobacter baumannii]EHU2486444.1 hypothetical protein [Acinetobacter baumannii]